MKMKDDNICPKCGGYKREATYFCDFCFSRISFKEEEASMPSYPNEEDVVHHPKHYISHPSGIECIDVVKHMNYCLGNAMKYIWRAGLKGDCIEDLEKAKQYLDFEIERIGE